MIPCVGESAVRVEADDGETEKERERRYLATKTTTPQPSDPQPLEGNIFPTFVFVYNLYLLIFSCQSLRGVHKSTVFASYLSFKGCVVEREQLYHFVHGG